ncbi:nidogen-like domain-containing protein [Longibacter sp.]|uniref:nidogen-like domain-containing protein n=1 Tax=Longibacter sp. TaxID=2045415 RepID=UPI003EBE56C3
MRTQPNIRAVLQLIAFALLLSASVLLSPVATAAQQVSGDSDPNGEASSTETPASSSSAASRDAVPALSDQARKQQIKAAARELSLRSERNSGGDRKAQRLWEDHQRLIGSHAATRPKNGGGLLIPLDDTFRVVQFGQSPRTDDGSSSVILLPFPFEFYGTVRDSVYLNMNGNLNFARPDTTFTSTPLPNDSSPLIAPFFADVDNRNTRSGLVYQRIDSNQNRIVFTWSSVGYFDQNVDKVNTFQVLLSDGNDPLMGIGNNVCFAYGPMEWTTGDASGGVDGLGGFPATVGVNEGNGIDYSLVGRFNTPGSSYDGPGGEPDGVGYLSGQRFCFSTQSGNLPPVALDLPQDGTSNVSFGDTYRDTLRFIGPEVGQTVSTVLANRSELPGNVVVSLTDGNPSTAVIEFTPTAAQARQEFDLVFESTDNGSPSASTVTDLTINVTSEPVTILPDRIRFGLQEVGSTSDSRSVVVYNTSEEPLSVESLTLESNVFSIISDSGEQALGFGDSRELEVQFQPDTLREEFAFLDVETSNGSASTFMDGTGFDLGVDPNPEVAASTALTIDGTLPDSFVPTTRELCFRPGGEVEYRCEPVTLSQDNSFEGVLPAQFTTERGVQYYLRFVEEGIEVTETLTFPGTDPETEPAQVRVTFDEITSPTTLPPQTYRMVSIPLDLDDATVGSVFEDDLDPYDDTQWRLVEWSAEANAYEERSAPDDPLTAGRSYFLITREESSFDVGSGRSSDLREPRTLTLEPGWHQISNPFAFPVDWLDVEGVDRVAGPYRFDGTGFVLSQGPLLPWNGYFVLNTSLEPVTLSIPPREAGQPLPGVASDVGGVPSANARKLADARLDREAGAFTVRVTAATPDGGRDAYNVVGMAPSARDQRDPLDRFEPPPIDGRVRLSILDGEHPLMRSVKSVSDGQVWDLEVQTSASLAAPRPVTLRFHHLGTLPRSHRLVLVDDTDGALIPLYGNRAEVTLKPGSPSQRLRLVIGTEQFLSSLHDGSLPAPRATAFLPNYPNPVRESTTLPFTLAEPSRVTIEVFDIIGRRVAELVDSTYPAGSHSIQWNGETRGREPVASGVYLVRMTAGAYSNTQKLVVIR